MKQGDMGIEELLRMHAQSLAREVSTIDVAALSRRVIASLGAVTPVDDGTPVPGCPPWAAGHPPAGSRLRDRGVNEEVSDAGDSPQILENVTAELIPCLEAANAGDPSSARRVAELLECAGRDEEAADWWREAAKLGDRDAVDYVEGILDGGLSSQEGSRELDGGDFPPAGSCPGITISHQLASSVSTTGSWNVNTGWTREASHRGNMAEHAQAGQRISPVSSPSGLIQAVFKTRKTVQMERKERGS